MPSRVAFHTSFVVSNMPLVAFHTSFVVSNMPLVAFHTSFVVSKMPSSDLSHFFCGANNTIMALHETVSL
jgi:hypothetical protein